MDQTYSEHVNQIYTVPLTVKFPTWQDVCSCSLKTENINLKLWKSHLVKLL